MSRLTLRARDSISRYSRPPRLDERRPSVPSNTSSYHAVVQSLDTDWPCTLLRLR